MTKSQRILLVTLLVIPLMAIAMATLMIYLLFEDHAESMNARGLRNKLPSDNEMIAFFVEHRQGLEQLAHEAKLMESGAWFAGQSREDTANLVTNILNDLHIYSARNDFGDIVVNYAASGFHDEGWYKAFVWTQKSLANRKTVPDLDRFAAQLGKRNGEGWRHIDGHWYLRYQAFY